MDMNSLLEEGIIISPQWFDKSPYLKGYRPYMESYKYYFRSIFDLKHNEFLNIWTHLIGVLSSLVLIVYTHAKHLMGNVGYDYLAMYAFLYCSFTSFLFSTIMHIFHPVNERVYKTTLALDYIGINLAFVGVFIPYIYYSFYNEIILKKFYLGILIAVGIISSFICALNMFKKNLVSVRLIGFSLPILSGYISIITHKVIFPNSDDLYLTSVYYLVMISLIFGIGIFFYLSGVPERFYDPERKFGKRDIIFQSHVIYHFITLVAFAYNYYGIYETFLQSVAV